MKKYRFLYIFNIESVHYQYCMIINHTYTKNKAEHYELLKINQNFFDLNFLNDMKINNYFQNIIGNHNSNNNKQINNNIEKMSYKDLMNTRDDSKDITKESNKKNYFGNNNHSIII